MFGSLRSWRSASSPCPLLALCPPPPSRCYPLPLPLPLPSGCRLEPAPGPAGDGPLPPHRPAEAGAGHPPGHDAQRGGQDAAPRQREADAGAPGHQEGRVPGRVHRRGARTPACSAARRVAHASWLPHASAAPGWGPVMPPTPPPPHPPSRSPIHLPQAAAARGGGGSSSLKAEDLLELLKADISLDDVPQSGEADDAVRSAGDGVQAGGRAGGWVGGRRWGDCQVCLPDSCFCLQASCCCCLRCLLLLTCLPAPTCLALLRRPRRCWSASSTAATWRPARSGLTPRAASATRWWRRSTAPACSREWSRGSGCCPLWRPPAPCILQHKPDPSMTDRRRPTAGKHSFPACSSALP